MWQRNRATAEFAISLAVASILIASALAGCDLSTDVKEVPEQSKKAIVQRKIDVTPGKAKSARAGRATSEGRGSGR